MQVENVECLEGDHIKFDFLGKDSIRYENEVVVHPKVHQLVKKFCQQTSDKNCEQPPARVSLADAIVYCLFSVCCVGLFIADAIVHCLFVVLACYNTLLCATIGYWTDSLSCHFNYCGPVCISA